MAVRSYNGRVLYNSNATLNAAVGDVARTTSGWIEDIVGGITAIQKSTSMSAEFDSAVLRDGRKTIKLSTTDATGRAYAIFGLDIEPPASTTVTRLNLYAFRVKPNTQYKVTCYAKTENAVTNQVYITDSQYDSNGLRVASDSLITNRLSGTNNFTLLTGTGTTNVKTAYITLQARLNATAGNISDAWFDNVTLEEVLPARTTITSRSTISQPRVAVRDMGTALLFNSGGTNRIDLGNAIDGSLATSGVFTLEVYAKRTNATYAMPICLAGGGVGKIGIAITATDTVQGRITNGANSEVNFASTRTVANGTFNRLTLTFDGSTARIYINGILAATQAYVGLTVANDVNYVGQRPTNNDRFNGIIDEVRIWNRALTGAEVANIHFNDVIPRDGLLREYLLDEATGLVATDTGSDAVNGTITGATYTTDVPLRPRTSV